MTRQNFRKLIILEWLLGFITIVVYFTTENYLPPPLRDFLEQEKNDEVTTLDSIILAFSFVAFITYVITYVGLYKFKPWAKTLLLPIQIVGLLTMIPHGPSISTSWVAVLNHSYSIVVGGILFLVYLSPVSEMFKDDNIS